MRWVLDPVLQQCSLYELKNYNHLDCCFFSNCNETEFPGGPGLKNPPVDAGDTGLILINYILHIIVGFPGGSAGRNVPAIHEIGFDPWVGKIPWRREW